MKLNPPETAPRDGTGILISFDQKPMRYAFWNRTYERWIVAFYQEGEFISPHIRHERLDCWLPMPQIDNEGNVTWQTASPE